MPRKRKKAINPPLNIYKKIALSFIVLTILLIIVVFYFTLSYAYITVYPNQEEISSEFNFIIVEDETIADPQEGMFVGKIVNQTVVGEKSFTTTGTKELAGDVVGQVKLISKLSRDQILIATTRVLATDGTLFRLQNRVVVPSNGNIMAEVYADDESKATVLAGTKFTIPGLNSQLQKIVYAETSSGISPKGRTVKAVSQTEMDNAVEILANELSKQVLTDEDKDKVKILKKEIITREFNSEIGDEVTEFTLKLTVQVIGAIFEPKPVKEFAVNVLEGMINLDRELIALNADSLIFEVEKHDLDNRLAQIKSSVNGLTVVSEESPILDKDKIIDLDPDQIKVYLEAFDEIESVEIGFFPGIVKKVPYFKDHIIIKIVE